MTNKRYQIFIPKSIVFSSYCLTLFSFFFTSLFPPFSHFQKMGVTWEERFRFTFVSVCFPIVLKRSLTSSFSLHSLIFRTVLVSPSLRLCFPIDVKAKVKRCQSEGKAKFYRTSIEDLSKKGWRGSGEGAEREQRKNLATKLQNSEVSFSPFWSLVSLNGTFWHFLVVSVIYWHFLALFGR